MIGRKIVCFWKRERTGFSIKGNVKEFDNAYKAWASKNKIVICLKAK